MTPVAFEKVADIRFDEYFKGEPTIMHVYVFTATEWTGEPIETEEMAPMWFSIDAIPYTDMWSDDPYWLPQVIAGKKIDADFILDESDVILEHTIKEVIRFN